MARLNSVIRALLGLLEEMKIVPIDEGAIWVSRNCQPQLVIRKVRAISNIFCFITGLLVSHDVN